MTDKTTTIQVYEDVKAKLEEQREEKESLNDVLRRLLDMDEPETDSILKDRTPSGYSTTITEERFVNNESKNWEFIESLGLDDDEKQDLVCGDFGICDVTANGVKFDFNLQSTLELELRSHTKEGLMNKIMKLKEVLPFDVDVEKLNIYSCFAMSEADLKKGK